MILQIFVVEQQFWVYTISTCGFPGLVFLRAIVISSIEKGCECGVLFSVVDLSFFKSFLSFMVWARYLGTIEFLYIT